MDVLKNDVKLLMGNLLVQIVHTLLKEGINKLFCDYSYMYVE